MSNILNMINHARTSNPVEFSKSFQAEMSDRISAAVQDRRTEVVSSMFTAKDDK